MSCVPARWRAACRRLSTASASAPATTKPFYVTTPIFYPNAEPHIGHLYSLVLADIFARYRRLAQPTHAAGVRFITGTDEHGLKIQKAARDRGVSESALVDALGARFKELASRADISYTRFVRTSAPPHKAGVQHLWTELARRGHIYKSTHAGFYSITDECFYTPTQITTRPNPRTGAPEAVASETGSAVEWAEEVNWKFRLAAFREPLIAHLERNPSWIHPAPQHALTLNTLLAARSDPALLPDLSVSRPRARLAWGVRVPDDDTQTVYVWLDALSAYLTGIGYPWASAADMRASGWPCDMHVIGKDILKFHAIYFPAFLLALDLPLPRAILSHAHWTSNRAKMSKSVGNVVAPLPLLSSSSISSPPFVPNSERDPTASATTAIGGDINADADADAAKTDVTRWYLARVGGRFRDDVDWSSAQRAKAAAELRAVLGNLLLRVAGAKVLRRMAEGEVEVGVDGGASDVRPGPQTEEEREMERRYWADVPLDRALLLAESECKPGEVNGVQEPNGGSGAEWRAALRALKGKYTAHMERLELGDAVDAIVHVLNLANAHISHTRPWAPTTPLGEVRSTLVWARETLRVAGILLLPIIPRTGSRLLDALGVGVGVDERALEKAEVGRGRVCPGPMRGVVLVPKDSDLDPAEL